ncbi:hypothetical protein [Trichlorobacter ammonificans]|uniref:Cytoplasmic protein n=1 Tax=Trichlorobacter ammonificans TaxID=2916410 RepID=A0ABM9DAA7_9BACT|nr:hypothetical protein [Trichlorobacter ammonificans]CAH2031328.1 conserved protein of unknown function [Trichlorobacter ammonificans]
MIPSAASPLDRTLAAICERCPVCRQARRSQAGIAFTLVKRIETSLCPFCRAYERVHGIKAHERLPSAPPERS